MDLKVGLIGLGNAGKAMLSALSRHRPVLVFDKDSARYAGMPQSASIAQSVQELGGACDIVVLSLPTPLASQEVAGQLATSMRPGAMLVETSTVAPGDIDCLSQVLAPPGARVIDAAIVGGVDKLSAGQGVFLVGSPACEAGEAGELLLGIAEEVFFLPRHGDGMRAKIAANAVAHAVYAVLVEAGALAVAQGIPAEVFQHLLERESGLMRPLTHRFAERLRRGQFAGGMPTLNARKDSALALAAARDLGVETPTLAAAHGIYEQAIARGLGELDYASLGSMWETALGITFRDGVADDRGSDPA